MFWQIYQLSRACRIVNLKYIKFIQNKSLFYVMLKFSNNLKYLGLKNIVNCPMFVDLKLNVQWWNKMCLNIFRNPLKKLLQSVS